MNRLSCVLAVIGVLLLTSTGCGKGNRTTKGGTGEGAPADTSSHGETKNTAGGKSGGGTSVTSKSSTKAVPTREAVGSGTLTESDNEREFRYKQGQIITVVLNANHASGFSWSLTEPAGTVIVSEGKPTYAMTGGKSSHGIETWHFRAAKPGYQTVKMEYRRSWGSIAERTFRFSGTVVAAR